MGTNDLTKTEILRAASNSENAAVKKAYEKLKFAISLAHTAEELKELAASDIYHLRISQRTPSGEEYENIMIRWCEEDFVLYIPSEGGTVGGKGQKLDKDPAIVYIKNPPDITDNIDEEIKQAKISMYGKI